MSPGLMCRPCTECEKHALEAVTVLKLVGKAVADRTGPLQGQVAPVSLPFLCRGDDTGLKPSSNIRVAWYQPCECRVGAGVRCLSLGPVGRGEWKRSEKLWRR